MIKALKDWNRRRLSNRRNADTLRHQRWIERNETPPPEKSSGPLLSVIIPVFNPSPSFLRAAIKSVSCQSARNVELCIVDDASTKSTIKKYLEALPTSNPNIKINVIFRVRHGGKVAACNDAIKIASGEWLTILGQEDLLHSDAVAWLNYIVSRHTDVKFIYGDEDRVDHHDKRFLPFFKPNLNRDLILSQNYIANSTFIQRDLVLKVGVLRPELSGAEGFDLVLRCLDAITDQEVHHIPKILYHWRVAPTEPDVAVFGNSITADAAVKAVADAVRTMGYVNADISARSGPAEIRVKYPRPAVEPLVSIIIPTRNALHLVRTAIKSILSKTTYKNYELILVDNDSDDAEALRYFSELASNNVATVIHDGGAFNYARINNGAAKIARGDYLLLMNNDIEVLEPDWLSEMMSHAIRKNIGCVGAKLLYPNRTLQHAGVVVGLGGIAGHVFGGRPENEGGYFNRAQALQEYSAVTAACLLVKKSTFLEVGGLDEYYFAVAYNDIDLCLKIKQLGLKNIYTPYATLFHHESATRGFDVEGKNLIRWQKEAAAFKEKWARMIDNDPMFNPNLSLSSGQFETAETSRS